MKRITLAGIIIFMLSFGLLRAHPIEIQGKYGGMLQIDILNMTKMPNNDVGGEIKITYNNFSILPGIVFNGTIDGGFSTVNKEGILYVDFYNGDHFDLTYNGEEYTVVFPMDFSIILDIKTFKCKEINAIGENSPYIMLNNIKIPVNCDMKNLLLGF